MTAAEVSALDAARWLSQYLPLYVGPIDERGDPAGWKGWQHSPVDPNVMDRWRPGLAVGAVGGTTCDFIDVDPRHGGDLSAKGMRQAGLLPRVFGWARTPQGGAHYVIAPLGVGSRDGIFPGVDLKGGKPDGTGRGFVFIAPTVRKAGTYSWAQLPDFDALAEGDETGEALAEHVRSLRSGEGWTKEELAPRYIGPPPVGREAAYLDAVLRNLAEQVAGTPDGRRNIALYTAAMKAGSFVAGAGLDAEQARAVLSEAAATAGLDRTEIARSWKSGFDNGERHPRAVPPPPGHTERQRQSAGPKYVPLSEVDETKFAWAWRGYLPRGGLAVIEGDGGLGKSTVLIDLAARFSTHGVMPDGSAGPTGAALILTREDDVRSIVKGRVRVAGGDVAHVFVHNPDDFGDTALPDDVGDLEKFITRHGIVLLGLDPWVSFLRPGLDYYHEQDVREALTPLIAMAERTGITALLVRHWRKGGGKAIERGLGSVSISNVVRMVLPVVPDPDHPGQYVLSSGKANYVPGGVVSMPYRIVGSDPNDPATARIEWQSPDGTRKLADLLADEEDGEQRYQSGDCADWLDAYLRDHQHQAERKEIIKQARTDGFTWSDKVWRSACKKLDLDTHERTATARPGTIWKLDVKRPPRPNRARRAVTPPPVTPSPIYPQVTSEGVSDEGQQIRGLQIPDESSHALAGYEGVTGGVADAKPPDLTDPTGAADAAARDESLSDQPGLPFEGFTP